MDEGQLTGHDGIVVVRQDETMIYLNDMWQNQHHLIKKSHGGLHAPKSLHVAAKKIFNTGKSVDSLRILRREAHGLRQDPSKEDAMTYESVFQPANLDLFSPFADLLDIAFNKWIADKHRASLLDFRAQLDSRCGLQSSLDLTVYLLR